MNGHVEKQYVPSWLGEHGCCVAGAVYSTDKGRVASGTLSGHRTLCCLSIFQGHHLGDPVLSSW